MTSTRSLLIVLTIAVVGAMVPAGTASASPGALRVLIAHADGAHTEQALKNEIAAQPGVAVVDTLDAGATTPSLTTLRSYDLVLTFSNTDYANSTMLGSELATYADQGGVVVEFAFDWAARAERRLGGRWATAGYSPYDVATAAISAGGTLGTHEASSPLLAGVNALDTSTHQNPLLAPGAVEVAKWADGQSAIAFKGRAVGVNACVADGCSTFGGDFGKLILNAANTRVVGQLVAPDTMCARPDTFLQTGVADGNSYVVPSAGVITSWYVQDGTPLATSARLRVARRETLDGFRLVGDSPAGTRAAGQVSGPFPARIPLQGGEVIGITTSGDGRCAKTTSAADTLLFPAGPPVDGITPMVRATGERFPVEAVVEPDADGDGFGDMTQDRCLGVAGSVDGCLRSDLSIEIAASAPTVTPGQDVTYTLAARNNGPDAAPGGTVKNPLPTGARLVSVSPSAGVCDRTVNCALGTIASGGSASIELVVTPTSPGSTTDTATVSSAADDPDLRNNSASATTSLIAPAVLSHLTQTHRRWRESGRRTHKRAPIGTTFAFELDKPAAVTLRFTRRGVTRGTLTRSGHAGLNKVRFTGRVTKKRKLTPGTYTVTVTATTPGVGSSAKALRFTIVR